MTNRHEGGKHQEEVKKGQFVLCTCCPLVDRFPTDTAIVRKPSRTMAISPNCSHDHSLILPDGKTKKVTQRNSFTHSSDNDSSHTQSHRYLSCSARLTLLP